MGDYGDLTWAANYTYIKDYETTFLTNDGLQTDSYNNQLDYGIFSNRLNTSLTWRKNNWRVRWALKWKGEIIDHQDRVDDYKERFATNDSRCASGDDRCVTNPEVPMFLYYPDTSRHDLTVSYTMSTNRIASMRWFGGVKNVFDDKGPMVPRTGDSEERGIGNFDSKFGGGIGRFVFGGVEMRFQ
jgi:hypothetical protein